DRQAADPAPASRADPGSLPVRPDCRTHRTSPRAPPVSAPDVRPAGMPTTHAVRARHPVRRAARRPAARPRTHRPGPTAPRESLQLRRPAATALAAVGYEAAPHTSR